MFLLRKQNRRGARIPIASRVTRELRTRLQERAAQSGYTVSEAVAELLEIALDLELKLNPFQPAIERLMREEKLTVLDAVLALLWMDVELNPNHDR